MRGSDATRVCQDGGRCVVSSGVLDKGEWMMLQHLVLQLAAASVLVAAAPGALAQTPPPATPTTKILAIGTFAPGTDMQLVQRTLAAEVRATAELYLEGQIDQWYSLEDRRGVVFILNVTDIGAAQAML